MHIALASCDDLLSWEVDDWPLHSALLRKGHTLTTPSWTDTSIDWSAFDVVVLRTTWDYASQRDRFVAWAQHVGSKTRLLNSADWVRWNTDKRYLRELEERGVATVPTVWLEPGDTPDVGEALAGWGVSKGFIKPVFGATARETLRFHADEAGIREAQAHLKRMLATEPMMLQPYLPSVERDGERSAIVIDGEITHAVVKRALPGDYRVQDDHGGTDAPVALSAAERALVSQALRVVDEPLLYCRVDMLRGSDDQPRLIELEAVEPSLFFRHGREAAIRLAEAIERAAEA